MASKVSFESISFKDLKMVCKQLNKSGLIDEDLKVVDVKKDDLIQNFLEAVESVPEAKEEEIPDEVANMYNSIVELIEGEPEAEEVEETEEATEEEVSEPEEEQVEETEPEEEPKEPEPEEKPKKAKAKASKPKKTDKKAEKADKKKADKKTGKKSAAKETKTDKPKKTNKAKKTAKEEKPKKEKKHIEKDALGARVGTGTAKINEYLLGKGGTHKQIGEELGTPPSRVKNHIMALQRSGVVFDKQEVDIDGRVLYSYKIKEIPDKFVKV